MKIYKQEEQNKINSLGLKDIKSKTGVCNTALIPTVTFDSKTKKRKSGTRNVENKEKKETRITFLKTQP